jgi:hypothetical protein
LRKWVWGSSWPVVLGSGICFTQTTTFMSSSYPLSNRPTTLSARTLSPG